MSPYDWKFISIFLAKPLNKMLLAIAFAILCCCILRRPSSAQIALQLRHRRHAHEVVGQRPWNILEVQQHAHEVVIYDRKTSLEVNIF